MQPIETMKFVNMVSPTSATLAASAALTVANLVDTKGWGHLRVLFVCGDIAVASSAAPKLQMCDTTDGSFADITSAALAAAILTTSDGYMYAIDVDLTKGTIKRYVQPLATKQTDSTTGSGLAVLGILSRPCSGSMGGGYSAAGLTAAVVSV